MVLPEENQVSGGEPSLIQQAIREAMDAPITPPSSRSRARYPSDHPPPRPHLPLRQASAQRLRERQSAPRPYFNHTQARQQLRGFNPLPVQPQPRLDNVTASSEHAFAKRDTKRPARLPLDPHIVQQAAQNRDTSDDWPLPWPGSNASRSSGPPSPSSLPPPSSHKSKGLRNTRSLGDGLRSHRHPITTPPESVLDDGPTTARSSLSKYSVRAEGMRASFRSAMTTDSSLLNAGGFATPRSSQATGNSSQSLAQGYPDSETEQDMSVEDAIGMYEFGFESSRPSLDEEDDESPSRPASQSVADTVKSERPNMLHRRSQSASLLTQWKTLNPPDNKQDTKDKIKPSQNTSKINRPSQSTEVPRDRYGFKKISHHVTVEQYDAWNEHYAEHLERRRRKWEVLMQSFGLSTNDPIRFPPKNDKIKRYVRKGIPPELRGAAWFWYAGGPGKLAKDPGLYQHLLRQVEEGKLTDNDREHIERDLNRTFPDNIQFKPDAIPGASVEDVLNNRHFSKEAETPMVQALRRVLQAFAVHNPNIGYCQSLNFIAGLLLLFLKEDEEKAFTLLNIVTTVHLPGTHGVALEGANIDIAVLMSCIKDTLPNVWAKLDDKGGGLVNEAAGNSLRLPTVSLATTAWFMSLFVGTLPIESVLRVWDCLFFEGSKTLFRIAIAVFKAGEREIVSVSDPMEIFQVVQTIPRSMLDINGLMEVCFRRRGGFAHISQGLIEQRRQERRAAVKNDVSLMGNDRARWTRRWRTRTKA